MWLTTIVGKKGFSIVLVTVTDVMPLESVSGQEMQRPSKLFYSERQTDWPTVSQRPEKSEDTPEAPQRRQPSEPSRLNIILCEKQEAESRKSPIWCFPWLTSPWCRSLRSGRQCISRT